MTGARVDLELGARRRWVAGARFAPEQRRFFGANGDPSGSAPGVTSLTSAPTTAVSVPPATPGYGTTSGFSPSGIPFSWGGLNPWGMGSGTPWNLAQVMGPGALQGLFAASSGMPQMPAMGVPPMTSYTSPTPAAPAAATATPQSSVAGQNGGAWSAYMPTGGGR